MGSMIAADVVMLLHFCFIAFALLGSFLVLRWFRVIWAHIAAVAWAGWIEASGNICPLTPLENHFRELAGQTPYGEGFITHYLGPIIYPAGLSRNTQFLMLAILVAVNVAGYALVFRKHRAR